MPLPGKWMSGDKESEIQYIIQKLTNTGRKNLDENEMKKLKSICKLSDKYVNCAYYSLMTQLRKDHAEIRYSALLIINELFCRSSVFRCKLELDFEEFLELVEGTDPEKPLPLPASVAKDMRIKGLEFIKNWASKYGEKLIRLPLAITFLKNCRKVDFNDMEARNVAERERHHQEQERLERFTNEKISKVKNEIQENNEELSNVVIQMENCFRLLIPHSSNNLFSVEDFKEQSPSLNASENYSNSNDIDSSNENGCHSSSLDERLRDHGLYDMKKTIAIEVKKDSEIEVNEDTFHIIENLKDLEKQICVKYYPMVSRWLKILTKGNNCSDILKKVIDIKLMLESSLEKYKEMKLNPCNTKVDSDEDDDDFEEVQEKDGYEDKVKVDKILKFSETQSSYSERISSTKESSDWKIKYDDDIKDPTSAASTLSKKFKNCDLILSDANIEKLESISPDKEEKNSKTELFQKAPILPYDIDLYHWEEEKLMVPEVVKFDTPHRFLESKNDVEESETLKELQIASLRTRKIDFSGKFEPVKWTCRAPLPTGKLCPRQDRFKCPFHGKIIPRDKLGNPSGDPSSIPGTSKETTTTDIPDWQDPYLLQDIEAATGIDLKIPDKSKKAKGTKRKKDGLTNIKQINNSVRERLSKKLAKRYKHFAGKLDELDKKRFNDKFGDQWNYY